MDQIDRTDLLDLGNRESVIRKVLSERGTLRLSDFDYDPFVIHEGLSINYFRVDNDEPRRIRELIDPTVTILESFGFRNVHPAIYEAVKNAHEHGNGNDRNKVVGLHYLVDDKGFEVLVEDEGGVVNEHFLPFVMRAVSRNDSSGFYDFYRFSGYPKPQHHSGIGTYVIVMQMDNVSYHLGPKSRGLLVRMKKTVLDE